MNRKCCMGFTVWVIEGRLEEVGFKMPSERVWGLGWAKRGRESVPDGCCYCAESTGTYINIITVVCRCCDFLYGCVTFRWITKNCFTLLLLCMLCVCLKWRPTLCMLQFVKNGQGQYCYLETSVVRCFDVCVVFCSVSVYILKWLSEKKNWILNCDWKENEDSSESVIGQFIPDLQFNDRKKSPDGRRRNIGNAEQWS